MAHSKVTLTCKNHPHLRWCTKPEAIFNGSYTGARNIFYMGTAPLEEYGDGSGWKTDIKEPECPCPASDLIIAPDNKCDR